MKAESTVGAPTCCISNESYTSFFRFNTYQTTYHYGVVFAVYYDSLTVQRQYERLIYDVPGFLSALGGSMGLYLGLSVLSILFLFVDAVPKMQDVLDKKTKVGRKKRAKAVLAVH
jgi:hypothetical protein